MAFLKGFIAFIIALVVILLLWYVTTGLRLPNNVATTTTVNATTTTVVSKGVSNTTTVPTTTGLFVYNCKTISVAQSASNRSTYECSWSGGALGVWIASGNALYENVTIVGVNNVTYLSAKNINYHCMTFYDNFTAPAQTYKIYVQTGPATNYTGPSCLTAGLKLNTTLSPPNTVYRQVYNGDFGNGKYTGWTTQGTGFGTEPLNISVANANGVSPCYIGRPWSNYNGTYFATTFNCGLNEAPGNLTSVPFYADEPFLNFRIVSHQDEYIYVEILYNGTPYIIARYNTFNESLYSNGCNQTEQVLPNSTSSVSCADSQFRNASIPLYSVTGKPIQIKVVADTQISESYVAIGDFSIGLTPDQDRGVLYNLTCLQGC